MAPIGPITHIVVHYSATAPRDHVDVEVIREWHLARGFNDIGYHYVIYRDGSVHKGREDHVRGAHVKNKNTGKIGICWIGGVEPSDRDKGVDNKTVKQEQSLIRLIRGLLDKHPDAEVVGHRDLAATECPGQDIIPWWHSVETGEAPPPPPPDVPPRPERPARTPDGDGGVGEDDPVKAAALGAAVAATVLLLWKPYVKLLKRLPWWGRIVAVLVPAALVFGLWTWWV